MTTQLEGRKVSLSHLGISCLDIDAMIGFYTEVMGMTVADQGEVGRGFRIAFLTSDPGDHHQLVLAAGRKNTTVRSGPVLGGDAGAAIFQMSFRLDSIGTIRRMVDRLKAAGIVDFSPMNHGNAWAVYSRDIEGNAIELFVDSPWYVKQPCGFALDLSKSDDEILAETEAYCRAQPECEPTPEWSAALARRIVAAQASI